MKSFETRPVNLLALSSISRMGWPVSLGRFVAFLGAMLDGRIRAQYGVSHNLAGHAWTDSLERQLNDDAASCRRHRL